MNWIPEEALPFGERIESLWKRGIRLARCGAIAFALSAVAAIGVGAAVTENSLVQILVTALATLAFWGPSFLIVLSAERRITRRATDHGGAPGGAPQSANPRDDEAWRRLFAVAPAASSRLTVLRRSLERSRLSLGRAELDPEAHELCILIDSRLPDLIHSELEILPPDDRGRRQKIRELVELVEQFARYCSRRGSGDTADAGFRAEVLRRRFEARLTEF